MSMLSLSQQIARTSDLQIPHGYLETASQLRKFTDRRQPFFRHFLQHLIPPVHQECIGGPVGTSHSSPELIELGQSHIVCIMNDHGIYIGNIQSGLNNRCRYQNVNISIDKIIHDPLQFPFLHLPVGECHICFRHQFCNGITHLHNGIDPVVYIIDLSAPVQFSADCLPDHFFIVFHHISLDLLPFIRCLLQHTHIPDTDQAHM